MTNEITIKTLIENESIIEKGLNTFYDVGNALISIRDNKQYKEEYDTFECYCIERWGIKKAYAYRLMTASETTDNLSTIVDVLPENEGQAQQLSKVPPEEQAEVWTQTQDETGKEQPTAAEIKEVVERKQDGSFHISNKENDWYTPVEIIDSARKVMGSITLDPASSNMAQEVVCAEHYYTKENDGLEQDWFGSVWLNPPYSMPEIGLFINKLVNSSLDGSIVLTNNSSDTRWFHLLLEHSNLVCFTKGRISFTNPSMETMATRQGQAFFYSGENKDSFIQEFRKYGEILEVVS
ncbi:MAG: hypothetical protein GOV02_01715 [Candidatus Aenigmarchaeota archaeon]|nr:hypothetical protein [Candidatus Aenigmarchaeota archaeon]